MLIRGQIVLAADERGLTQIRLTAGKFLKGCQGVHYPMLYFFYGRAAFIVSLGIVTERTV